MRLNVDIFGNTGDSSEEDFDNFNSGVEASDGTEMSAFFYK